MIRRVNAFDTWFCKKQFSVDLIELKRSTADRWAIKQAALDAVTAVYADNAVAVNGQRLNSV